MIARLTEKELLEIREFVGELPSATLTRGQAVPLICAAKDLLDEVDALKVELTVAETRASQWAGLADVQHSVAKTAEDGNAALLRLAERRGWNACREAAARMCLDAFHHKAPFWLAKSDSQNAAAGIRTIEPREAVAARPHQHECTIEQEEHSTCECDCGATWENK